MKESVEEIFTVSPDEVGMRLDRLLAAHFPSHSRTYFQYLIEHAFILVNGKQVKKREKMQAGDEIEVCFSLTPEIALLPEPIPLDILYEDEALIVINKPVGMVVHPAVGHASGTFANALLYYCKTLGGWEGLRPGIVHRLDKNTSGVLIAAKTRFAHAALVAAFAQRKVKKRYIAVCIGAPREGIVDAPIARHPLQRQKMAVCPMHGKEAKTDVRILHKNASLSCVELDLMTGRTHQIRVHMQHLKAPILGDPIYGWESNNKKFNAQRPMLHAASISLLHPLFGTELSIQAPLPPDLCSFIDRIHKNCSSSIMQM